MREQFQYYFMSNIMYSGSFFKINYAKGLEETMDFLYILVFYNRLKLIKYTRTDTK